MIYLSKLITGLTALTSQLNSGRDIVPIEDDWGKTKQYIINKNQTLYGADVETFKITSTFQGKDKNYNYEFGAISQDDFKKENYKTFDFDNKDICVTEPIVFVDIYDSLVSYLEDKYEPIEIVEKLKGKDFKINDIRYLDRIGESKIIRVSMTNNKCKCIVEKLYRYDYGKPSETKNIFKVTERIYCEPK